MPPGEARGLFVCMVCVQMMCSSLLPTNVPVPVCMCVLRLRLQFYGITSQTAYALNSSKQHTLVSWRV